MSLSHQYLELIQQMFKEFYKLYYRDKDEEYADIDADYSNYCHAIWSTSNNPVSPYWPLDIYEWTYIRTIDDVWTALMYNIPKYILHNFWRDHREDYNCKETYMKVNLWHYYRINYDNDVYQKELEDERKESLERVMNTAWLLDEMLWQEKWTFYNQYIKSSLSHTNNNEHSSSENLGE